MPPNDPRLLSLTIEEIEADYWAHYYAELQGEEIEDEDFDLEALKNSGPDDWEDVVKHG